MQNKKQVTEQQFLKNLKWTRDKLLNANSVAQIKGLGNYLGSLEVTLQDQDIIDLREKVRTLYSQKLELFSYTAEAKIDAYEENLCGRQEAEFLGGQELHYHMYYDIIDITSAVKSIPFEQYLARVNQYGIWKRKILNAKSVKHLKYLSSQLYRQQKMQDSSSNFPAKYSDKFWKFYRLKMKQLQRIEATKKAQEPKRIFVQGERRISA